MTALKKKKTKRTPPPPVEWVLLSANCPPCSSQTTLAPTAPRDTTLAPIALADTPVFRCPDVGAIVSPVRWMEASHSVHQFVEALSSFGTSQRRFSTASVRPSVIGCRRREGGTRDQGEPVTAERAPSVSHRRRRASPPFSTVARRRNRRRGVDERTDGLQSIGRLSSGR